MLSNKSFLYIPDIYHVAKVNQIFKFSGSPLQFSFQKVIKSFYIDTLYQLSLHLVILKSKKNDRRKWPKIGIIYLLLFDMKIELLLCKLALNLTFIGMFNDIRKFSKISFWS